MSLWSQVYEALHRVMNGNSTSWTAQNDPRYMLFGSLVRFGE